MKFRELWNTNQNDLEQIYIYLDEDQWENEAPEEMLAADMRGVSDGYLRMYVDAWFIDVNFVLHVLLS